MKMNETDRKGGLRVEEVRVQLDEAKPIVDRIEQEVSDLGLSTRRTFYMEAVSFLLWAIRMARQGKEVIAIDPKTGEVHRVASNALERAFRSPATKTLPASKKRS